MLTMLGQLCIGDQLLDIVLGRNLVSLKSKKQNVVTRFSAAVETKTMTRDM